MDQVTYKENTKGYKVLTPDGYKSFAGIRCVGDRPIFRIEFSTDKWLECTDNHKLFTSNSIRTPVSELLVGDTVLSTEGEITVLKISSTGKVEPVYDLIEVEDGHRYYTNGILSSNCEFIISEETLIAPAKLIEMEGIEPQYRVGQVRWYKQPEAGKVYAIALDPSLGTGGDYSAIQIIEVNTTIQIGEWRHNRTRIPDQIKLVADICKYINSYVNDIQSIYYSVENNSVGEAALVCIDQYGEENIEGYFLSEGGKGRTYRKGYNTNHKTKIAACSKLKVLIETNKMSVNSTPLISELKTFIASGLSYAAKIGETDDLVMSMVLAIRMMQTLQNYHPEIDKQLRDFNEHIVPPLPFISMSF